MCLNNFNHKLYVKNMRYNGCQKIVCIALCNVYITITRKLGCHMLDLIKT